MEQRAHLYTLAGVCALPRALSPHRELSPHSDMAALPQTGDATLPLRQLALSPLLCTCGKRTPCYASYSLSTSLVIALTEVIPIAIYHCNISIVSRGKGKSAVAAAAYRSGEKLTNEWDGMTHDYTRKGGVVHTEIMLSPHAPPSFADRSTLWNSVELYEKAGNAQKKSGRALQTFSGRKRTFQTVKRCRLQERRKSCLTSWQNISRWQKSRNWKNRIIT